MRKSFPVILMLFLSGQIFGLQKTDLDLDRPLAEKNQGVAKTASGVIHNDQLEATLIEGAYFTLGTRNGLSNLKMDDNKDIAYGHPYAKTSFPVVAVEGVWVKPEDGFELITLQNPNAQTLSIHYKAENGLAFTQSLTLQNGTAALRMTFTNQGVGALSIQPGLIFDPSLGEHGDASLEINGEMIPREKKWNVSPQSLDLWERHSLARGLGINLNWDSAPARITGANWRKLYQNFTPDMDPGDPELIYDLTLGLYWSSICLEAGESFEVTISFSLFEPEFLSELFMRWDMPNFLTIEDGVMFPTELTSTVDIWNQGERVITEGQLRLEYPAFLESDSDINSVTVPKVEHAYPKVAVEFPEVFTDRVVPLKLEFEYHGLVLDSLIRNVFIPASPLADTGLVVTIDSLIFDQYPEVGVIFNAEVEKTGWKLLNLRPYNLLLYENDLLVDEFELGKAEVAGSNLADVVFVLDCSGSMGDEIGQVRQYIGEFGDELNAGGYDFQVGVVTFSTTVDDVWDLTNNLTQVRNNLAGIQLWGGEEDSPSAMMRAMELSFRPQSKRTLIWITDEPYPERLFTQEDVVNQALAMEVTIHGVGLPELQTEWFNPIVLPTGGNFYDITGDFKDILLDVSRMDSQFKQKVTYQSPIGGAQSRNVRLEVHYGGRGGFAEQVYNPGGNAKSAQPLACYPNPFNPELAILVKNPSAQAGTLQIFNVLGQRIWQQSLSRKTEESIRWRAETGSGLPVSAGYYFVQLQFEKTTADRKAQTQKVLYLK